MILCDAHIHIVDDASAHPMIPHRSYTPAPATLSALRRVSAPAGVGRFVVVQPSFYGTDNTVTLEAADALGADGAAVVVIDPAADAATLRAMDARRVRGVRLNLYSMHGAGAGGGLAARFAGMAAIAGRMGWHVQVIADLPVLIEAAPVLAGVLAESAAPVVIDHYGLPGGAAPDSDQGRALLELLRRPHVWVKLSAPYRSTGDAMGIAPDPAWLSALLGAAPGRCVWGSDWPHTPAHEDLPGEARPAPYRALDYGAMVRAFRGAVGDEAVADRVMGTAPALLYRFAA